MVIRDDVREAQRALDALDAARVRAVDRLDRAVARRTEIVAETDRQVATARSGVEAAIVEMARQVGVDPAAALAGVEATEVRGLSKTSPSAVAGKGGAG
jgi:hypothetical protein